MLFGEVIDSNSKVDMKLVYRVDPKFNYAPTWMYGNYKFVFCFTNILLPFHNILLKCSIHHILVSLMGDFLPALERQAQRFRPGARYHERIIENEEEYRRIAERAQLCLASLKDHAPLRE